MAIAKSVSSPPVPMTFEEYLGWCNREDVNAEWVDGEIVPLSPNTLKHQLLSRFLALVLQPYVLKLRLGEVLYAPFAMKLEQTRSSREPDLMFVSRGNLDRLGETYLDGPADLAIEIVSRESRVRDREVKRREYERAGVREYWLLDPEKRTAEFLRLGEEGRYHFGDVDESGIYRSVVVEGFWLRVEWLWDQPDSEEVLELLRL